MAERQWVARSEVVSKMSLSRPLQMRFSLIRPEGAEAFHVYVSGVPDVNVTRNDFARIEACLNALMGVPVEALDRLNPGFLAEVVRQTLEDKDR